MYFPIGWPKVLQIPDLGGTHIKQVTSNRDRILFAILTDDTLSIWFCKPCVPIVYHQRPKQSLEKFGTNVIVEWKPDSSKLVIATSEGHLLFYTLNVIVDQKGLYIQTDSPHANLRRDSAELFIKEIIPPLHLTLSEEALLWDGAITSIACITMTEIMVATTKSHVLRYKWDGTQNRDYNLDLRRIPFCINQQVSKAIPIVEENTFIIDIEYSPLVGGFAIVLNDGRAAFLTASSLRFDPNQVQGIWAQGIEDATCASVNHKYRLITFGRENAECIVYHIDESTGGLAVSHACTLSSKDYPGSPGPVHEICWTPDGCAMAVSWKRGGIAMWSTFGALLMCSLAWDYGLHVDLQKRNPLHVISMEWGTEGYQLWMVHKLYDKTSNNEQKDTNGNDEACEIDNEEANATNMIQMDFAKSALTINPCMSHQSHLYLQGEDKLYINSADTLIKIFSDRSKEDNVFGDAGSPLSTNSLAEGRQWLVLPTPSTYSATNWPIRYSAIDQDGQSMAIAGRTGLAHYSMQSRRWKLFGNESQEKDFIVSGGLLWWHDYMVLGCYSIIDNGDEIRLYPKECKLDNKFAKIIRVSAPVLLMNSLQDQLITFGSDGQVTIWHLRQFDSVGYVEVNKMQVIDISALCIHPACIVSITLTTLRTESGRGQNNNSESMVLNISGRLLMVQREAKNGDRYTCSMPTVLASCVENVWVPSKRKADKAHLTEALWLFCGSHGMRVWLPLYPRDGDKSHTFMSKRIMLPFHLRIYPLAILFEDAIILGAENDTVLYTTDSNSPFSLPFNVLQRTSQVYLHQILRQLIRRNLGYHAWEIARSCTSLPYFPHSLELLLHEVLEEEATSKEPIPDAQLPSVIEFIMEFPVYLQTVVQCARKTEIALWPYLFSAAGKPKDLFQECMANRHLDTAASYLIILQNLETSSVSRQHATLLLDTALDQSKWELAKDLVRFLRAIDPNDVESPRNSMILPNKLSLSQTTPPVSPNAEDISLILGNVQRARSFSTTITPKLPEAKVSLAASTIAESPVVMRRKKSVTGGTTKSENRDSTSSNTAEEFFIDVILQRHARRLLSLRRLSDLGYFAAHLDFHLVAWLGKERERAARIDDFVACLKQLHEDFSWPYPAELNVLPNSAQSLPESPNIDDKFKALHIDTSINVPSSRVGDSGYMSFTGVPCVAGLVTPQNTIEMSSQVTETNASEITEMDASSPKPMFYDDGFEKKINLFDANAKSRTSIGNYRMMETQIRANAAMDDMSVISSVWGEDRDFVNTGGSENWEVPSTQILEQLSNGGNKGSQRSEVQLRYLLQLFMEASCLEWSLLISVLLRDALAVLRTVNAAKSPDQSIESVKRLKQGLQILHYWTHSQCLGYKPFMLAIQNQISVLSTILATKIQHQQILDHQRVVSATLSKVSSPIPVQRTRKASSNNESVGSHTAKSSVSSNIATKERLSEVSTNHHPPDVPNNLPETYEASIIPESTTCILS
ncbi:PREDICTED: guanine nucleotide exchange factor subunit Rich [Nicrophorus vespilloides]|uniref:Protein RIC1 homolog n=1 Tax=Nicrophorus vespilloides TaxID=110193 RepID=A0ABM1M3R9_NICVS|nr:PREDICTED: guanine nucleotide exchange factor subunit Rich [Nicrophorus vespilloides]XP_017769220.1 PREDICTED: guanine nucleotide exchange factor subunit Rich [Nicrophorus vespilloides]